MGIRFRVSSHGPTILVAGVAVLLGACGGGGGGSGGNPQLAMQLSTNSITVSAAVTDPAPSASVTVTLSPAPPAGTQVFVAANETHTGIASVTGSGVGTSVTATINFTAPNTLGPGTYRDTVTLAACFDQACTQQVSNSPQTVAVQYTVTGSSVVLSTLTPNSASAGSAAFTLTATGSGFMPGAVLLWNGNPRATALGSSTQLTAQITAADIATQGSVPVTVSVGAAVSNAVTFTIGPPPPAGVTKVSPSTVTAGGLPFTLTVLGQSFTNTSIVEWNGSQRTTTFVSATELLAQIPATDIATATSASVTVLTGAVLSNVATVTVAPPSIDALAFQIDAAHSGAIQFKSVSFPSSSKWSVNVGGTPSYALIAAGKVFVTVGVGGSSQLLALDQATGATVWGPVVLGGGNASAAYDAGRVFTVTSTIGTAALMQGFDAATGALKWSTSLAGQYSFSSGPSAGNGYVYTGGAGSSGTLYAVDQTNGVIAWTQGVANGDDSTPVVTADGVYVTYPCETYDFRPATGELIWNNQTGCSGGGGATPVSANGALYAPNGFGSYNGSTFNAQTGALIGPYVADNPPAISTSAGYFLQSGTLRGVTLSNNTVLWSFAGVSGDGGLVTSPIAVNQYVFVGSSNGTLYALDGTSGSKMWQVSVGAGLAHGPGWGAGIPYSSLSAGDGLLVVPAGNTVTAYTLSTNP